MKAYTRTYGGLQARTLPKIPVPDSSYRVDGATPRAPYPVAHNDERTDVVDLLPELASYRIGNYIRPQFGSQVLDVLANRAW